MLRSTFHRPLTSTSGPEGMNVKKTILVLGCLLSSAAFGQQDLDQSARALGFRSFQHYQQARASCMDLLSKNPLVSGNLNCGTNVECLQREADAMQRLYQALTQSPAWVNNKCDVVVQIEQGLRGGGSGSRRESYEIEVSHNDELFIINGEKFEAKTYCFNMEEGDEVIFIEGSTLGACASATVVNLRTKDKCELWCE